uniref:2-dehydro-3-deoxyphosphogluconate aldolase n=1 Tax=Oryza glumipatula TaxID=40148 RepID=A0A0E0AHD2_9ORYZ
MLVAAAHSPASTALPRRRRRSAAPPSRKTPESQALRAILRSRVIACLRAQELLVIFAEVGTVLNPEDARKAIRAGAQFLMSPGTVMEILHALKESEVLYIPGVLTPTEVISASSAGAEVVKVYPVSVMGGEVYMLALKKPFPFLPMVASQGISIDSIKRYLEAGASAVVLSDAIFDKVLMRERKFDEISELANLATLRASQSGT